MSGTRRVLQQIFRTATRMMDMILLLLIYVLIWCVACGGGFFLAVPKSSFLSHWHFQVGAGFLFLWPGLHQDKGIAAGSLGNRQSYCASPPTTSSPRRIFLQDDPNFSSFDKTYVQMFICLTTANFPDVGMIAFHNSHWAPLFFVIYVGIGLYFVLNLFLALVSRNVQKFDELVLFPSPNVTRVPLFFSFFSGLPSLYQTRPDEVQAYAAAQTQGAAQGFCAGG